MKRTVPLECTRIECVRAWFPKKRTPRTRSPSVMPVAQKITLSLLHEIVDGQHAVEIAEAHRDRALGLFFVARLQAAHEVAAQTLDRGRRQHAFGRAAGAHRDVNAGRFDRGCDARIHVAVGDQT